MMVLLLLRSRAAAAEATGGDRRPVEWNGRVRSGRELRFRPVTAGRDQPRTGAPDGWLQMHDANSAASRQRQFREGRIIEGNPRQAATTRQRAGRELASV
jgi:hypothetical protein